MGGAEDAGFVEEGVVGGSSCREEERVCWGGADELSEGDIVLQEGQLVGGVEGLSEAGQSRVLMGDGRVLT